MKVQHQFRWKAISKICTARKKKKQNKTKQIHNYTYTYIYTYIKIKRYIFHVHFHMYMKYIENYTWEHVDMEFLFECLTRYLTSEMSSLTREEKSPYLYATMCYFVYHINIIALY